MANDRIKVIIALMKEIKKITDNHAFFVDFSLFWVIFGWLALTLSLLDFFYVWIFIFYLLAGGTYFIWTILKRKRHMKLSKNFIAINIVLALTVILFSFFVSPTVFTGRDQGSISNAAAMLAKNHNLHFSNSASKEFFSIYGPGKALNFPGFHYTDQGELTTQFPLGYISWLGAFYSLFKIPGFIIANAVTLFLFFISFYMVGRKLLKRRYALMMMLFTLTSFSFMWFFKFTLSENLALALLWMMIMSVLYLLNDPGKKTILLFVLTSTLLIFTRVEGYAFLITSILILFFNKQSRAFLKSNSHFIYVSALSFVIVFALNFQRDLPFFKEIAKASIGIFFETEDNGKIIVKSLFSPGIRITQIYILYGLAGFLLAGFFGMTHALIKKNHQVLLPLYIAFPTLIYLIDSNISSDHPWMLRRFVFSILPIFIFYTTYLLKNLLEKNPDNARHPMLLRYSAVALTVFLVALNLKSFSRFVFFSENKGLLEQTKTLSEKFSDRDLILIDQLSSADGWSLLAGPMNTFFNKQAVYFFNLSDLQKIDLQKFENIYILTSKQQLPFYASSELAPHLNIQEKYSLETTRLVESQKKDILPIMRYPLKETVQIEGYILKFKK